MKTGSELSPPISVVIPCHNEATAIADVIRGAREALGEREHEVLIVDDGSSDGTAAIAEGAGARVLRLDPNRGKGVALDEGARAARYEHLVFLDGDGQDEPREIPDLLLELRPGVDLVIGSRFLGTLHPGAIHPLNRQANVAFTRLIALAFGQRVTDSQAGFRALRRGPFLSLGIGAREYDVETEMLCKALRRGWRVVEIPVSRYPRAGSVTDFNRVRHGLLILGTIIRERLRAAP